MALVIRNFAGESFIERLVAESEEEAKLEAKRLRTTTRRKIRVVGTKVYVGLGKLSRN